MDLAKHPELLGNLFEQNGDTLVLAAHAKASARPLRAGRLPALHRVPPAW